MYDHRIAAGRCVSCDPLFGVSGENRQSSLGACVLDRRAQECVDQFLKDHLDQNLDPLHGSDAVNGSEPVSI
jgi:hypothetical protein